MAARNSLVGDAVTLPLLQPVRDRLQEFLISTNAKAESRASDADIEAELGLLTFSFTSARTVSKDEAAIRLHEYTGVLRGFPLWAIREGFQRIKNGEVDGVSRTFLPAAPEIRAVVTDVMRPLLADRYEVARVLNARIAPPENQQMADRVRRLTKQELLQKYGPDYGIGGTPANEIGRSDAPSKPVSEAMSREAILAHYKTYGAGFKPKVKRYEDRYGDRYEDDPLDGANIDGEQVV